MWSLLTRDKRLGSASKRDYDIPLGKNEGTDFLVLLIALMTFLAVMALSGSFALSSMTKRWSSGLENKLTIEIPAEKSNGDLRTKQQINEFTDKVVQSLADNDDIESFEALSEQNIQDLISPWLGEDMVLDQIPLPALISVQVKNLEADSLMRLEKDMALINNNIRIDTHESWLLSLLRVTGALTLSASAITVIIGLTTIVAVAGGVRARMAIHRADVELLHLMGARDDYITKQFQRHALILSAKGAAIGVVMSLITLFLLNMFMAQDSAGSIIPSISLNAVQLVGLVMLPALACIIAAVASRLTVLRVLSSMP